MPATRATPRANRSTVIAAFLALYIVWGSTYLGMHYAVATIPPLIMAGTRFLLAGVILYAIARARGTAAPLGPEWRSAAITGIALMGSNATVAVAVRFVPTGVAALLVAMSPLWFALLDWWRPGGRRPRRLVIAGLALGLVGMGVLVGPSKLIGGEHVNPLGALILMLSSLAWVAGSVYSRHAPRAQSSVIMAAAQMMAGGATILAVSVLIGQFGAFHVADVSLSSWLAFGYLIVFGSLVGFTSYIFLLVVSTPARVSTYAYVNPLVAVFLGWALAGEPVTSRVLAAAALILGAVALMTRK